MTSLERSLAVNYSLSTQHNETRSHVLWTKDAPLVYK